MSGSDSHLWRLAPAVRWLDDVTLAGGNPYRVITLTGRGSNVVREILGGSSSDHDAVVQELLVHLQHAGLLLAPAPTPARDFAVTVVIPARSAPGPVATLLDRLGQSIPVILVDDGSCEPLTDLAATRPNVAVLRHPVSRGPGAARNTGAAQVLTPWMAFLDADTQPDPGWIMELKGRIDQADNTASLERDRIVLAAPRIYPLPGSGWVGWFENRACALDLGGGQSDVGIGKTVSYVPSAAMLVDTAAFRQCGGFDESMQVGEDVDLVWRLAATGRIRYMPDVRVGHRPRASLWGALRRRADYGTSAADLGRRHPGSLRHVDVSIWSFGPWALGVLIHPLVGLTAAGITAAIAPWGMPDLTAQHARKLAAQGHLLAGGALGRWLIRPMAPATILLSLAFPAVGRRLALAATGGLAHLVSMDVRSARISTASGWAAARIAGESLIARTLDDLAYSTGVWIGVIQRRTLEPVLPRIRDVSLGWLRRGRHARRA